MGSLPPQRSEHGSECDFQSSSNPVSRSDPSPLFLTSRFQCCEDCGGNRTDGKNPPTHQADWAPDRAPVTVGPGGELGGQKTESSLCKKGKEGHRPVL